MRFATHDHSRNSARRPHQQSSVARHPLTRPGVLWTVQGGLALLFLFAGGMKLVMPMDELADESGLPGPFMVFIGAAELLGALGLVLPGLFRIRIGLTPLAAAGLVIIMAGATLMTAIDTGVAPALMPLTVGLLAAFVAYSRWRLASQHRSPGTQARQAAGQIA